MHTTREIAHQSSTLPALQQAETTRSHTTLKRLVSRSLVVTSQHRSGVTHIKRDHIEAGTGKVKLKN